ncbi:MAG: DNA polymerase I [Firmicutes bacterium]|nr:DNA polymerase I [Bacillota bacterium]
MKKIVLIDGNNLMFRSYYATAYNGNMMRNSKDFPTNALYGFTSMINKIIAEESPAYMAVAFDIGKNFRKQEFAFYKEGRNTTPEELKMQMPIARKLLDAMGIKHLELEPYEADDIIGSLVQMASEDSDFDATIISSDKDLLQLINYETDVKLLKQTGYIRYNEKSFFEDYGIEPIKIIDLKALMGDASDNIPGVKGIGEKTALKLLVEYGSLENIYDNLDSIKGSVHDKLVNDKENAFMSKKIATIYTHVPLDIRLEDLKYDGPNYEELKNVYRDLEFHSFLKGIDIHKEKKDIQYITVTEDINVVLKDEVALYIMLDNEVYTKANVIGASVTDGKYTYYFSPEHFSKLNEILKNKKVITYDHKKNLYFLDSDLKAYDDLMISSYLLNYNVKDDLAFLAGLLGENIEYQANLLKNNDLKEFIHNIVLRVNFIYEYHHVLKEKLETENLIELYEKVELPLINVLAKMEKFGVQIDSDVLIKQGVEISTKLAELTSKIYEYAGEEFNIASVKQLGEVLFDKMQIAKGKKNKTGYKTDVATLEKLKDEHPIINLILEYRNLAKLKSTYIDGLQTCINADKKIHTIFKQTIARTGRLSSIEPNLQNIPVREEQGRKIREAFIPSNDLFLSCDYSQIELRLLAHIADCPSMIETFKNDGDIHTKVASDINGVEVSEVTKEMRSKAKSVIFGIVYGISSYGLMENIHVNKKEADYFIEKYYTMYPEVKQYMSQMVAKAKTNGYVTTMFGRKRVIDEINNSNYMIRQSGERMAINTPIQGSAADIIKMAMIKIADAFTNAHIESKMVLQVHDELIFDVKLDELNKVKEIVTDVMENVVELSVPLKVSADTGANWYDTK